MHPALLMHDALLMHPALLMLPALLMHPAILATVAWGKDKKQDTTAHLANVSISKWQLNRR